VPVVFEIAIHGRLAARCNVLKSHPGATFVGVGLVIDNCVRMWRCVCGVGGVEHLPQEETVLDNEAERFLTE
jgi:hypothetical protein